MAEKKKFPNPQFFRARNNMDWKKQAENLKEFRLSPSSGSRRIVATLQGE